MRGSNIKRRKRLIGTEIRQAEDFGNVRFLIMSSGTNQILKIYGTTLILIRKGGLKNIVVSKSHSEENEYVIYKHS